MAGNGAALHLPATPRPSRRQGVERTECCAARNCIALQNCLARQPPVHPRGRGRGRARDRSPDSQPRRNDTRSSRRWRPHLPEGRPDSVGLFPSVASRGRDAAAYSGGSVPDSHRFPSSSIVRPHLAGCDRDSLCQSTGATGKRTVGAQSRVRQRQKRAPTGRLLGSAGPPSLPPPSSLGSAAKEHLTSFTPVHARPRPSTPVHARQIRARSAIGASREQHLSSISRRSLPQPRARHAGPRCL